MQIVINIPEEVYNSVQLCNEFPMRPEYEHVVRYAIKNCITLPEKHGRIVDIDAVLRKNRPRGISDEVWEESGLYKVLNNAQVIIKGRPS